MLHHQNQKESKIISQDSISQPCSFPTELHVFVIDAEPYHSSPSGRCASTRPFMNSFPNFARSCMFCRSLLPAITLKSLSVCLYLMSSVPYLCRSPVSVVLALRERHSKTSLYAFVKVLATRIPHGSLAAGSGANRWLL